jgi:hypothetical protein
LVFTNGDSRIADNTLASIKSIFGLTSIGSPTNVNGQVVSLGEVFVNQDYITQVFDRTSSRIVEMNQPASSPVIFTTTTSLAGVAGNSIFAEKGYKEWVGTIDVNGTNAATGNTLYNTMGVSPTVTTVTGGTINSNASTVYWKVDFPGVVTSGNISSNSVVNITPGNQGSLNTASPRVSLGTAEETSSFVIATWTSSVANAGITSRLLVAIKFFA